MVLMLYTFTFYRDKLGYPEGVHLNFYSFICFLLSKTLSPTKKKILSRKELYTGTTKESSQSLSMKKGWYASNSSLAVPGKNCRQLHPECAIYDSSIDICQHIARPWGTEYLFWLLEQRFFLMLMNTPYLQNRIFYYCIMQINDR